MASYDSNIKDIQLLWYVIASADMRYCEIGEREISLKYEPAAGFAVRAKLVGSEEGCCVDLAQILLEYSLSCEGWRDLQVQRGLVGEFGRHLGELIAVNIHQQIPALPAADEVATIFEAILNSVQASYSKEAHADLLLYSLASCPLNQAAHDAGMGRGIAMAYHAFVALCDGALQKVAPAWVLVKPIYYENDPRLSEVRLKAVNQALSS